MSITETYMKEKPDSIESYQKYIDKSQRHFDTLKGRLGQYIPSKLFELSQQKGTRFFVSASASEDSIFFTIPWNPELADKIALQLEVFGWKLDSENKSSYEGSKPEYYLRYKHSDLPNLKFIINMESSNTESTCRLIPIKTELVEKITWEVRCENGDENE